MALGVIDVAPGRAVCAPILNDVAVVACFAAQTWCVLAADRVHRRGVTFWHARCLYATIQNCDCDMSDIISVIRALCAEADSATAGDCTVSPALMCRAFAAILDGGASDLETGALIAVSASIEAQRDCARYSEVVLGLHDAISERMVSLVVDDDSAPIVVLANYGDDWRTASLSLLALLLRRIGVRVLLHGALETYGGLFNCGVLREFGILPATTRSQAQKQLVDAGIAVVPATLYSPALANMLSLKNRLGISTPAHSLANLLMPLRSTRSALHLVHSPFWLRPGLENEKLLREGRVLLLSVSPGNAAFDGCRPRIAFRDDESGGIWQVLFEEERFQAKVNPAAEASPAIGDPRGWAEWTKKQLAGKVVPPTPIVNLLASCLFGCGYATDMNKAKAIAAVQTNSLAAA